MVAYRVLRALSAQEAILALIRRDRRRAKAAAGKNALGAEEPANRRLATHPGCVQPVE